MFAMNFFLNSHILAQSQTPPHYFTKIGGFDTTWTLFKQYEMPKVDQNHLSNHKAFARL